MKGSDDMPKILPIKELKNTAEISELCHDSSEPIYITKNGYGDMVIMSMETYEELTKRLEAYHDFLKSGEKSETEENQGKDTKLKVLTMDEIKVAVKTQLDKYKADYAILFGSYARGEATPESDVDLIIVGGERFNDTDIFALGEDFREMIGRSADVYEICEIDENSLLYENIMREGIKIA